MKKFLDRVLIRMLDRVDDRIRSPDVGYIWGNVLHCVENRVHVRVFDHVEHLIWDPMQEKIDA